MQAEPGGQAWRQPPQCSGSVLRSTHVPRRLLPGSVSQHSSPGPQHRATGPAALGTTQKAVPAPMHCAQTRTQKSRSGPRGKSASHGDSRQPPHSSKQALSMPWHAFLQASQSRMHSCHCWRRSWYCCRVSPRRRRGGGPQIWRRHSPLAQAEGSRPKEANSAPAKNPPIRRSASRRVVDLASAFDRSSNASAMAHPPPIQDLSSGAREWPSVPCWLPTVTETSELALFTEKELATAYLNVQ